MAEQTTEVVQVTQEAVVRLPVPRPFAEAEWVPVTPTTTRGPHRLLAYALVHSMRCLGHVPPLILGLILQTRKTATLLALYIALRRTDQWKTNVHLLTRFGTSNRPRFLKARRTPYDQSKQYIHSHHPHGVLLCPWFSIVAREEVPSPGDPAHTGFSTAMEALDGLALTLCFAPAVQYYLLHGEMYRHKVTDVKASTLRRVLQKGRKGPKPESVCLCVGGFSEACYTGYSDKYEVAFIKERYGFMKIAIEEGVDIIPTYSFGAQDMYWGWDWKRHSRAVMSQKLGLPLVGWSGRFGTNMPYFEDTVTVSFDPFPASQYRSDQLELAHEHYCHYLKTCFDAYKGCCKSTKDKELVFAGRNQPPKIPTPEPRSAL